MPQFFKKIKPQNQLPITTTTVAKRLREIVPFLQKVAKDDFSKNIEIPLKKDEFTELLVALNLMINELKQAREQNKENENKYRRLFENAQDAIIIVDFKDGTIIDVNQFIGNILGYSREEFLKKKIWEISPLKDVIKNKRKFKELKTKGYLRYEDLPLETKKGKRVYVEFISNVYQSNAHKMIQCTVRDVTERRKAEEKIKIRSKELAGKVQDLERTREALLNVTEDADKKRKELAQAKAKDEAMLKSVGDGLVATDEQGRIILLNRAAEKMLGWQSEKVQGKLLYKVVRLEEEQGKIMPIKERPLLIALKTGKTTTTTTTTKNFFYVRQDGTRFPIALSVTPVILEGKIIGAVDVFRDITEEKQIEKMRMDFLSLASHQLRTPLSGTKWLIETIQGKALGPLTKKQKEYLNEIYQLNERMIKLVVDMLNALQLESNTMLLKTKIIFVSDLYSEIILMMSAAAKKNGILLRNLFENNKTVKVKTDPSIIRNILEIFIANAINYSSLGKEIILGAKEEDSVITCFVKDKGIGIPKDEQKLVFKRFYRASNAKKIKPSGTGLGLYIATMLADKIGAKISFKSQKNKGSTFSLHLPKKLNQGLKTKNKKTKNYNKLK